MRAPPESFSPTRGAPTFIARSMSLQIFAAFVSERDPPKTVKSCAKTNTGRPSTRTDPATTPSPGISFAGSSIPKSRARWTTKGSISSKEPGSPRSSTRSRAVSFPALCCFSRRSAPPPSRDFSLRASSVASRSSIDRVMRLPLQRDLLLVGEHLLRLPEHLRVVDSRAADRRRVLREDFLHFVVQGALAVAVLDEDGLERPPQLRGRGRLHEPLGEDAARHVGCLRGEPGVGQGHWTIEDIPPSNRLRSYGLSRSESVPPGGRTPDTQASGGISASSSSSPYSSPQNE